MATTDYLPEKERESARRFHAQTALILDAKNIIDAPGVERISTLFGEPGNTTRRMLNTFTLVPNLTEQLGHYSTTNKFTKSANSGLLFELPPVLLSLLVPGIKLYKVFYKDKKSYSWQIPFDDYFGASEVSEKSLKIMTEQHRGKGNGSGIKSFEYRYVGVNPAETNTNIESSLTMFFSNVDDLMKIIPIDKNDIRFLEKTDDLGDGNILDFRYSDIVNQVSVTHLNPNTIEKYLYYRIKVICGYGNVTKKIIENLGLYFSSEKIDRVLDAIRSSKVILYLLPHSHEIKYNENGSVELTVHFQAVVDSYLFSNEVDIFKLSDKAIILKDLKQKLEVLSKSKTAYDADISSLKDRKACGVLDETEKKFKNIQDTLNLKLKELKKGMYSEVLRKMLLNRLLYNCKIDARLVGVSEKDQEEALTDPAALEQKRKAAASASIQKLKISIVQPTTVTEENLQATLEEQKPEDINVNNMIVDVNFFFLGDLIDIAAEVLDHPTAFKDMPTERPRIILGNILLPNLNALNNPNDDSSYDSISLSDIPICLQSYNEFFINKVLSTDRGYYPLMAFIKDVFTHLVFAALSPRAFGENVRLSNRISMYTFSLPSDNGVDLVTNKEIATKGGLIYPSDIFKTLDGRTSQPLLNYCFIYTSSQFKINIDVKNREEENDKKGIYHFRIGTDVGIIKKIEFKKTDNMFYREAKVLNEQSADAIRLKQVYDADIVMYGNNLYRPGDYIYIEPDIYSVKSNESDKTIGDIMGFGGYYMVNKVRTNINNYSFETHLDCIWQSGKEVHSSGIPGVDCTNISKSLTRLNEDIKSLEQELAKIGTTGVDVLKEIKHQVTWERKG